MGSWWHSPKFEGGCVERGKRGNGGKGNDLHNITQITSKWQGRSSSEAGLGVKSTACGRCSLAGHLQAAQLLSPGGERGAPRGTQQAGRRAPSSSPCRDAPLPSSFRAGHHPLQRCEAARPSELMGKTTEPRKFRPKAGLIRSGKTGQPSSAAFLCFL